MLSGRPLRVDAFLRTAHRTVLLLAATDEVAGLDAIAGVLIVALHVAVAGEHERVAAKVRCAHHLRLTPAPWSAQRTLR